MRTPHIPNSPECGLWESELPDALDGLLTAEELAVFDAHAAACPDCAALYEQAKQGRDWLGFLSAPEPPAHLVDSILAQTSGPESVTSQSFAAGTSAAVFLPQPWPQQRVYKPGFAGVVQRMQEPRLMMTAAMAFFSLALTMNLAGIPLGATVKAIATGNLHQTVRSTLERRVSEASTPLIRYYDHLRFVYEVESRMRELRQNNEQKQQPENNRESHKMTAPDTLLETELEISPSFFPRMEAKWTA